MNKILDLPLNSLSNGRTRDKSGPARLAKGTLTVVEDTTFGRVFDFSGTVEDYVIIHPADFFPESAITLTCWIKTDDTKKQDAAIFSYNLDKGNHFTLLDLKKLSLFLLDYKHVSQTKVNDGLWCHLAVTWQSDEGRLVFYKDGREILRKPARKNGALSKGGALVLGQEQDALAGGFAGSQAYVGRMAHVRMYDSVLSPEEILALIVEDKNIHAISARGVLYFDGKDDYIDLGKKPEFKIPRHITIEAWVKVQSQRKYAGILSNVYDSGSTESGYGLLLNGGNGLFFALRTPSGMIYLSADGIELDRWHHVAAVYDGSWARLYVDGVETGAQKIAAPNLDYDPENDLHIGRYKDNDEAYYFHGNILDVRLWDKARTPEEIKKDKHRRLKGNEPGLVAYWPLNEGDGNEAPDRAGNNNGIIAGATWLAEIPDFIRGGMAGMLLGPIPARGWPRRLAPYFRSVNPFWGSPGW